MKYFLIFLMDGVVKEITSNDEEAARDRTYDFWKASLDRTGGTKKRDYYEFNELQKLDQVW